MRRFILTLTLTLCLAGCNRYSPEEHLLPREDISLTVKGELILSYDPLTFQLGYNEENHEFRVFDDDMGNWFSLSCKGRPVLVGDEISGDLSWTASSTTKSRKGLIFRVEKTDSKGLIWLWCEDEAIGMVVKEF